MMKKNVILLLLLFLNSSFSGELANPYEPETKQRLEWFKDAKFGMMLYWSTYSIPEGILPDGKGVNGYAEWYLYHAVNSGQMTNTDFESYVNDFHGENFDADYIVERAKKAGMKYITVIAKHHDGFCIWPTAFTDYDIKLTPFYNKDGLKRDPLMELKNACKEHELKFCLYYSHVKDWFQWDAWQGNASSAIIPKLFPSELWDKDGDDVLDENWETNKDHDYYIKEIAVKQVIELCEKYEPDGFWFDTSGDMDKKRERGALFTNAIRSRLPNCIINNRLTTNGGHSDSDYYDLFDYISFGDNTTVGLLDTPHYGEAVLTAQDNTYSYHAERDWEKPWRIMEDIVDGCNVEFNVLLSYGLRKDGSLPETAVNKMKQFIQWKRLYKDGIFETRSLTYDKAGEFGGQRPNMAFRDNKIFIYQKAGNYGSDLKFHWADWETNPIVKAYDMVVGSDDINRITSNANGNVTIKPKVFAESELPHGENFESQPKITVVELTHNVFNADDTGNVELQVTGGIGSGLYESGSSVTIIADIAAHGYEFDAWTGNVSGIDKVNSPVAELLLSENTAVSSSYKLLTYALNASSTTGGNVSPSSTNVTHGSSVEVSAIADAGYTFTAWSGDISGVANPLILSNVSSDLNISATFEQNSYSVTFSSGVNGSISGDSVQAVLHGESATAPTVIANTGWTFTGWSGDFSAVTGNLQVTALYTEATVEPPASNLYYNADLDTDGNGSWEEINGSGENWALDNGVIRQAVTGSKFNFNHSYLFNGTGAEMSSIHDFDNPATQASASFEFWLKPSELSGDHVIFESGARSYGISMSVSSKGIQMAVQDLGSTPAFSIVNASLTLSKEEFTHIVGVVDMDNGSLLIFANGVLAAELSGITGLSDWAGGNNSGLGRVESNVNVEGLVPFKGEMHSFSFYKKALSSAEVQALYNVKLEPAEETPLVNFNNYTIESYGGSSQDKTGSVTIEDKGTVLKMSGNRWKAIQLPVTITENTILEFDFSSKMQGEVHGIGFDNDLSLTNTQFFQVYGTQSWGISHPTIYKGTGTTHYKVRLADFFTGSFNYIFFGMDDDAKAEGESLFSNVKIYEELP